MVSGMIRGQLIAFVVVTALGVSYACLQYLGVPRMLGVGIYRVTLELPRASGLYESAIVTYRGIQVGKVEQLDLDRTGVAAVLGIDDDASIPVDSVVTVRSTSAIGEQYVNFEPVPDSSAPPLRDGQVIPGDRVGLPTPAGDLLASVNQLAATLPLDKLHDTVDELYDAFNGTGPELAGLLRAGSRLQRLATEAFGSDIPVSSVRVGAVPGTHELLLDAAFEQIRVVHEARDRRAFAEGALAAALWLIGRRGVYTMRDFLLAEVPRA